MSDRHWHVLEQLVTTAAVMDVEHAEALLQTAAAFLALSDFCRGMRQGELLGLRWSDIDFESQTLSVAQQLQAGQLVDLKSAMSRRTLPMPDIAVNALLNHRSRQQHGSIASLRGLVFTTSTGTGIAARNLVRSFKALLRKVGLPESIRFHDLRHSALSYVVAHGVDPKTVQAIAGHSDVRLTLNVYSHAMAEGLRDAASVMDRVLTAPRRRSQ